MCYSLFWGSELKLLLSYLNLLKHLREQAWKGNVSPIPEKEPRDFPWRVFPLLFCSAFPIRDNVSTEASQGEIISTLLFKKKRDVGGLKTVLEWSSRKLVHLTFEEETDQHILTVSDWVGGPINTIVMAEATIQILILKCVMLAVYAVSLHL